MRSAFLAAAVLAALVGLCAAQDQDQDLAQTFSSLQSKAAAAQASLAARRAEIERLKAQLPRSGAVFSSDAKCKLIHNKPGGKAERARALVDEMAAHIMRANNLSIPGFCGIVLWPGDELDAGAFLLQHGDFPVSEDDRAQANAEAAVPKAIRIVAGTFQKAPDDSVLAAVLAHELAHLALGHPISSQMDDDALRDVAEEFNSSDFDRPLFGYLERSKLGHRQAQEAEADRLGRLYIARAGYDPSGMARMLSLLDDPVSKAGLSDHPAPDDRLRLLQSDSTEVKASAKPTPRLAEIRRLLR